MTAPLAVAAGCIERDGTFLLCRRPMGKARGGQWEFPGGKLEAGESAAQALERELREELAIEVRVGEIMARTVYTYPELTIELTLIRAQLTAGEPDNREHTALVWVTPAQAEAYDLCPADRLLLEQMKERNEDGISE